MIRVHRLFSRVLPILLILVSTGIPVHTIAAQAEPTPATVELVESTPGSMVLELRSGPLDTQTRVVSGQPCDLLSAPGLLPFSRPGRPVLPARGVMVSVPQISGLQLEVLDAQRELLPTTALCPSPNEPADPVIDSSIIPSDPAPTASLTSNYPGVLAELGTSGILRGQAVAQVQFYPLQVTIDPATGSQQITFYPRLRVRLSFDAQPTGLQSTQNTRDAFDPLRRSVLFNQPSGQAFIARPVAEPLDASSIQPYLPQPDPELPALKINVTEDGMYRISSSALVTAGWNLAKVDPTRLHLSHLGQEIPVLVEGEMDGTFATTGGIVFYGQAMTGRYTQQNVYWLTVGGEPGLRMIQRDTAPVNGYPIAASFPAKLHVESDILYLQNPIGREAWDHWYWKKLPAGSSADLPFQMPAVDPAGPNITITVQLLGRTNDAAINPDHHSRLTLNSKASNDALWYGQQFYSQVASFSPSLLVNGANKVTVLNVNDTGATVNTFNVNWLEVEYQASYAAQADVLAFQSPDAGDYQYQVKGFISADVNVFDISQPDAPALLVNVVKQSETNGTITAIFEDSSTAEAHYLATTPQKYKAPAAISADRPSNLHGLTNGADEIMITYDAFAADLQPLVALRKSQGLRVQVVNISDVYDEFSGGIFTPVAIRDFLSYAYHNWASPAPAYVLLVGDTSVDYMDHFATKKINYLPTFVFDSSANGETGNDTWFAQVDGDDPLPDLFIGRYSARSDQDVQAMVAKNVAYENRPMAGAWNKRALFVADDEDPNFERETEEWITRVPTDYQVQRIYNTQYATNGNPNQDIITAINNGVSLVSYSGHGNVDRWGTWSGGSLLLTADVSQLTNGSRLPFIVTATCLNGFFVHPTTDYSLAEELARKPGGGGVGVFSPATSGNTLDHEILFTGFFDSLYQSNASTWGAVTTAAKVYGFSNNVYQETIDTYLLFGDPATQIYPPWTKLFVPLMPQP